MSSAASNHYPEYHSYSYTVSALYPLLVEASTAKYSGAVDSLVVLDMNPTVSSFQILLAVILTGHYCSSDALHPSSFVFGLRPK